jgi:uncharacterized membrane protein (DUF4010 family)
VVIVGTVLNPKLGPTAALSLLPMFLTAILATLVLARRSQADRPEPRDGESGNPLQLAAAIKMTVAFLAVMFALEAARDYFGTGGVFVGAAAAGLTDMDALTLSMSRLAQEPGMVTTAAAALIVGVVANTVLKTGVALAFGGTEYRHRVAPSLLIVTAVGVATWFVLRSLLST